MLRHVVFFGFKPQTAEDQIGDLEASLSALPGSIPEICGFEFGRDIVRSERSFDFALVATFDDLSAMQRYQEHPDHQEVIEKVRRLCDRVVAVDFEV